MQDIDPNRGFRLPNPIGQSTPQATVQSNAYSPSVRFRANSQSYMAGFV
jgi:hypothetical protein